MIRQRIDAVTEINDSYLTEVCPPPISVKTETSNRCNYKCTFCALRTREKAGKEDMPWESLKHVMDITKAAGVKEWGCFYLGEATMASELLIDEIKYAKQIGFEYIFLTTNGSLLTKELASSVMEAGLDSLKFSINAADMAQFELVMQVKARNYAAAMDNLKTAYEVRNKNGFNTKIYASYIAFDGKQGEKMQRLLDTKVRPYADDVYALPLYSMGLRANEIEEATGYKPTHGNMGRLDESTGLPTRQGIPCWSVFKEAHVRIDRENGHPILSACCFGADARFDICDLMEYENFMDAWNHPKLQEIRGAHLRAIDDGPQALNGTMCEVCVAY